MGGVNHSFNRPQDCGVQLLIKVGHPWVPPVRREQVLNQVVAADAKEVDLRGKNIRHHGNRGNFQHHPQLNVLGQWNPRRTKLGPFFLQNCPGLVKLF